MVTAAAVEPFRRSEKKVLRSMLRRDQQRPAAIEFAEV
jgi:hypothetical protein